MRLSSRRSKVTWLKGAAWTVVAPPRGWLGSISPVADLMRRLLGWIWLAPNDRARGRTRQGPRAGKKAHAKTPRNSRANHEDVKETHNNAQFRSIAGHAGMENRQRCLKARSVKSPGFLSPPAPRGLTGRAD